MMQLIDAQSVLDRLERIEAAIRGTNRPQLLKARDAIKLFGGTKARFYALVGKGVIEKIQYDPADDAVYDADNIRAVIEQFRLPQRPEGKPGC